MANAGKETGAVLAVEDKVSKRSGNPYKTLKINTAEGKEFSCMLFKKTADNVGQMGLNYGDVVEVTWKEFGEPDERTGNRIIMGTFVRRTGAASVESGTPKAAASSPQQGNKDKGILKAVMMKCVTELDVAYIRASAPAPKAKDIVGRAFELYDLVDKAVDANPPTEAQVEEEAKLCEKIGEFGPENPAWKKYKKLNYKGYADNSDVMEMVLILLRQTADGKWETEKTEEGKLLFSPAPSAADLT